METNTESLLIVAIGGLLLVVLVAVVGVGVVGVPSLFMKHGPDNHAFVDTVGVWIHSKQKHIERRY